MRRRVKITGVGPVTPAGIGREAFFRGINESISRVRAIDRFDPGSGSFVGAELDSFDLREFLPKENPRRLSRHTQLGLVAAVLALKDAGLQDTDLGILNPIVITGTSIMDVDKIGRGIETVIKRGTRYSQAASIIYETSTVNVAAKIAQHLEVPTRMMTVQTSCCSGVDAIGQAVDLVANGQTELALAGGSECPLVFYPMLGFNASELSPTSDEMPDKACRPFDLWRSTGVLGEGASIFVLEPEDSPRKPLAWISGHGFANDPDGNAASGLYEAIKFALANASRRPNEVDYINAWGPGHRRIDPTEAAALRRIFGPRLNEIPVTSIKGAVGTALGASGPIQLASTVLSIENGIMPPTVNWETPDPDCELNLANHTRRMSVNVAVINAHGLSGSNSALVVER